MTRSKPISWNEIRARALEFSKRWSEESAEHAEAKSFWDDFFNVFGVTRKRVASFEEPVKHLAGEKRGFIDLFWKGVLLVEHKSRGKSLDKAYAQAIDYFPGIKERDLPRYILVSDFARFRLYDLEGGQHREFALKDLYKHVQLFGFIAGYQVRDFGKEDPVNIKAAEQLGKLHDELKASGYDGHVLEVFLVRLLFCLFAEDTGIFETKQFRDYLEEQTEEDGSDLGMHLGQLFQVLNTPQESRSKRLSESLGAFPYVNGKLFEKALPMASFDSSMRETLLDCGALNWSKISPSIFGSLFQSAMDPKARRNLGAHYTRELNILKAIGPLFVDKLRAEFESVRHDARRLQEFHSRLAEIRVLDPACGCGNFLVVAYRELRMLELDVLRELYRARKSGFLDVSELVFVDVDQFYGIEIEDFPAQIAQVALWLTDHQMNLLLSEEFGQYFVRLPLTKSASIVCGNALREDWAELVSPDDLSYIVGNPPFAGAKLLSDEQRADVGEVFHDTRNAGLLDYVACWYRKAADFMAENREIRTAFVSTNSITQGEQVGVLWPDLFKRGVRINFAHRTFQWSSEARGKATVQCVIIGLGLEDEPKKVIYEYDDPRGEPHAVAARNINPYLVDAPSIVLENRSAPLCDVPEIGIGNKPIDGGNFLFTADEHAAFLKKEPASAQWFRRWLGADEFLNSIEAWCLWLGDCPPGALRKLPEAMKRVEAVKRFRLSSKSAPTRKLGDTPTRFHVENIPSAPYLLIPRHTSERRAYIPMGYVQPDTLTGDSCLIATGISLYQFGVMSSSLHMAWVRAVCGRLESRYRYSAGIVYNNFPWPSAATEKQVGEVRAAAQAMLDERAKHRGSSLADLYDPVTMPAGLVKAHRALDQAVDVAYGKPKGFATEVERVSFLFAEYQKLTMSLPLEDERPKRRSRKPAMKAPAERRIGDVE